jgi:hypothetical protein
MERKAERDGFLFPSSLRSKLFMHNTKLFSKWGVGEKETKRHFKRANVYIERKA